MAKLKNLKITLIIMGIVVTTMLVLFSTQVSHASENASNDPVGTIKSSSGNCYQFSNYDQFEDICNDTLEDDNSLTIDLQRDFNFEEETYTIGKGRTFTFNLNNHQLYSNDDGDADTMLEVKGTLILKNGTVREVNDSDSTIIIKEYGTVQAENVNFIKPFNNDDKPSEGGFFYFEDITNNALFKNCSFSGIAKKGGAIYVNNSETTYRKLQFDDCEFKECHATSHGGAIYNRAENINLVFNNTKFTACHADEEGGAITTVNDDELMWFNNSTIDGCSAKQGGAIYNDANPATYTFDNTTIKNCSSTEEGGAIYSNGNHETYQFNNSTIDSCKAGQEGGAIFIRSSHASFTGNVSKDKKPEKEYGELNNCSVIKNCHSNWEGGGIYTSNKTGCGNHITIQNLHFFRNDCDTYGGGGISIYGDDNKILSCSFKENAGYNKGGSELSGGGAIAIAQRLDLIFGSSEVQINNCEFEDDKADSHPEFSTGKYRIKLTNTENNRFYTHNSTCKIEDYFAGEPSFVRNAFKVVYVK